MWILIISIYVKRIHLGFNLHMGLLASVNHLMEFQCVGIGKGLMAYITLIWALIGMDTKKVDTKLRNAFSRCIYCQFL